MDFPLAHPIALACISTHLNTQSENARDSAKKKKILAILLLVTFIGAFPLDVVLPSFPALASHFSTSLENLSLSLSLFVAGFTVAQLILGPLSDKLGRKKLLLAGLALASTGAIGAIFTENFHFFLAFRSLQAIGCGCFVLVNALIQDLYDSSERHQIRILTTTAGGLFISVAPLMGAALQALGDWPASFVSVTVIGVVAIAATAFWLPEAATSQTTPRRAATHLNLKILLNSTFLKGSLLSAIGFSCHLAFIVQSPVIFLDGLSLTNNAFALVLMCYGAAYLAGGALAAVMADQASRSFQMLFGLASIATAGVALLLNGLLLPSSMVGVLAPMILCTFGVTILRPAAATVAMDASANQAGTAASLHNAIIFTMGAAISALVTLAPVSPVLGLSIAVFVLGAVGLAIVQWSGPSACR